VTEVSVPVEGAVLAARISLPAEGSGPALVALHGAERGLKDWYLYEHLHEVLPPAGIAAITFDRRGEGGSTGKSSRGKFTLQAEDALAVVAQFARLPEVDAARVGLWGISQGGWVAPLAATLSESVAFLVLVASVGVTPGEQMRWTAGYQAGREYGQAAAEGAERIWSLCMDWMRGADRGPLEAAVADAKTKQWWPKVFFPDELPGDEAREEVRDELDFDPTPVFAAVDVPTLLFYGDQDEWIPVPESIAAWKKARPDNDVIVVPGTGHEPAVDEVVDPLYERTMVDWLERLG
jgi:pimeloyl-ACP methyl ester carboxylesterase